MLAHSNIDRQYFVRNFLVRTHRLSSDERVSIAAATLSVILCVPVKQNDLTLYMIHRENKKLVLCAKVALLRSKA